MSFRCLAVIPDFWVRDFGNPELPEFMRHGDFWIWKIQSSCEYDATQWVAEAVPLPLWDHVAFVGETSDETDELAAEWSDYIATKSKWMEIWLVQHEKERRVFGTDAAFPRAKWAEIEAEFYPDAAEVSRRADEVATVRPV